MLHPPLSETISERYLHNALTALTNPRISVSESVVRTWWKRYRNADAPQGPGSAKELEELHGDSIRPLAVEHPTAYRLCKALRDRDPPIHVTDGTAKQWLEKYCSAKIYVDNAGHLESRFGDCMRKDGPMGEGPVTLAAWLLREHSVSAPVRVTQTWLTRDWSSSGALYTTEQVEEALGERLRLDRYRMEFVTDDAARILSEILAESQPPVKASALLLRQWYSCLFKEAIAGARVGAWMVGINRPGTLTLAKAFFFEYTRVHQVSS